MKTGEIDFTVWGERGRMRGMRYMIIRGHKPIKRCFKGKVPVVLQLVRLDYGVSFALYPETAV